ncbi:MULTISPECIES: AI-2E family transporter [unclassified Methylophilus]|jgi:predicted PurR-regulated permease PerM|uniref:AI-2E family transporter n=1 Tax=unclassified Methylophilus TaxID=2630143 RepID=UPI0006F70490|nr:MULTISPECIES: AI-2E family transporter [unclassified Methylophilus]KQT42574.1 ABC transporter permease [Methylophilus sp. Leaf416]KQT56757.1 ABC transporter permease [Methylophilus sp. Leaf459]
MSDHEYQTSSVTQFVSENRWWIVAALFIYLFYLLEPVLTPFLAAMVIAYMLDPLVDRLSEAGYRQWKVGRTLATLLVMAGVILALIGLMLIILPLLQQQSMLIVQRLPAVVDHFHQQVEPWLLQHFGIRFNVNPAYIQKLLTEHWQSASSFVGSVLLSAGQKGLNLIGMLANILLLPVVLFYFLRDWDDMMTKIGELIPRDLIGRVKKIVKDIDSVVAEFLRGQLSVMLSLCVFYSVGLWLVGLDMALSIGMIAGLLSFVPYLGFALAFILAMILALLQFASLPEVVPVLLVFGVGQFVESFFLTPILVGDRIGLHPVLVILALMAGGQLFGFAGVLLALPVSAAIAVGLRYVKNSYLRSDTYLHSQASVIHLSDD